MLESLWLILFDRVGQKFADETTLSSRTAAVYMHSAIRPTGDDK